MRGRYPLEARNGARTAVRLVPVCLTALVAAQQPTPSRPTFTDVFPRSELTYVTKNDASDRKYLIQALCGGVALFDFDNDGLLDIFLTNGATLPELVKVDASFHNRLLRNRGNGTFADVTGGSGLSGADRGFTFGAAVGDFDNDGDGDLFVGSAGPDVLYRNNGDGTFTDVTSESGLAKPAALITLAGAWFDYDQDGLLDLVTASYTNWTPASDIRCHIKQQDVFCDPRRYPSVANRLYRNAGDGRFEDVTERSGFAQSRGKGMGISIADYDRDGRLDVFVANDTEPNFLYMNHGGGRFEERALDLGVAYGDTGLVVSSMGSDAKDYDEDGWVDLFYNDLKHEKWALFRNLGGSFEYVSHAARISRLSTPYSGWSAGFIDYNNDGWKDLYSANGDVEHMPPLAASQHDTMFENVDGRTFVDVTGEMGSDFLHVGLHRGAAFGDLNNDGFADLVVTALNEPPRILLNSGGPSHWLWLSLVGRHSPRDAIGAQVTVTTAAGRALHNQVAVSVGLMSSSDRRVHFGLGAETRIRTIEIVWPRGARQVIRDVAADQFLTIEEPGPGGSSADYGSCGEDGGGSCGSWYRRSTSSRARTPSSRSGSARWTTGSAARPPMTRSAFSSD